MKKSKKDITNKKEVYCNVTDSEHKEILLDIMDNVHSFCVQNDLKYSLMYGSLLGAIRHDGFIPWDDDIDIVMPRKDYEIFIDKFPKQNTKYFLINYKIDSKFYLPFTKLCDKNTILIENVWKPVELGANIDIFPLDYAGNNLDECYKTNKKIGKYRKLNSIQLTNLSNRRSFLKNFVIFTSRLFPRKKLISKINKLCLTLYEKSEYCAVLSLMTYKEREFLLGSKLNEVVEKNFENRYFYVFKNYDYVLKNIYGNYLELPPLEKRVSHHDYLLKWKQK